MRNHSIGRMVSQLGWPMACALAAGLAAGVAYLLLPATGGERSLARAGDDIPQVRIQTPAVRMVTADIRGIAKILPREEIPVAPEQAGWLRSLYIKPGQRLKAGKLIGAVQMLRKPSEDATRSYASAVQQSRLAEVEYAAAARDLAEAKAERSAAESRLVLAEKRRAGMDAAVEQGVEELAEAEQAVRTSRALVEARWELFERGLIARNKVAEAESARTDAEALARQGESNLGEMKRNSQELASAVVQAKLALQKAAESVPRAERQAEALQAVAQRRAASATRQRDRMAALTDGPLVPVRAPVDGVVIMVAARPGTLVTPASALAVIKRADVALAVFASEGPLTGGIKQGAPVVVSVSGGRLFTGKIVKAAPAANGGVQALLRIPDPKQVLRPGKSASAMIKNGQRKMIAVASSALSSADGKDFVWIFEDDSAARREVKVAGAVGDEILIESGLGDTDAVILEASRELVDGGAVRLME